MAILFKKSREKKGKKGKKREKREKWKKGKEKWKKGREKLKKGRKQSYGEKRGKNLTRGKNCGNKILKVLHSPCSIGRDVSFETFGSIVINWNITFK